MNDIDFMNMEELTNTEFPLLDHGFVRLEDKMGTDSSIVRAARTSYADGTKAVRSDQQLINYLWKNDHTGPFEFVEFVFHCKMPIFVARQWIRHRTASVNEMSARYSILKDEFFVPDDLRGQSKKNKQVAEGERNPEMKNPHDEQGLIEMIDDHMIASYDIYELLLKHDVGRELARVTLPTAIYTEWYWKIDLKNLLHFLRLRLSPHAQKEIRVYGEVMYDIVKSIVPMTCAAFEEWTLHSHRFSKSQMEVINELLDRANMASDKEGPDMKTSQLAQDIRGFLTT